MSRYSRVVSGLLTTSMIVGSIVIPGTSVFANSDIKIDKNSFPDEVFRAYIQKNFDDDSNLILDEGEVAKVTELQLNGEGIKDLTGVEFFTELETLVVSYNQLSKIDVSNNLKLTTLNCSDNNLESIDLTKNTELEDLNLQYNKLTSLDVSKNTKLQSLFINLNNLEKLDVSKNPDLVYLTCTMNNLTSLDVSKNKLLTTLVCNQNKINSLDLSMMTNLIYLDCSLNPIKKLDISKSLNLDVLLCINCGLTELNLNNNTKIRTLDCGYNPLGTLDLSKLRDITFLGIEAENLDELDVSCFPSLEFLNCSDNNLTELDLSNNSKLSDVYCSSNKLTELDLSALPELGYLSCADNNLSSLDVSHNPLLVSLYCGKNKLTELDVSKNKDLWELDCSYNQITSLAVTNSAGLEYLMCQNNNMKSLKIENASCLGVLEIFNNQLDSIDLSKTKLNDKEWGVQYINSDEVLSDKLKTSKVENYICISDDYDAYLENNGLAGGDYEMYLCWGSIDGAKDTYSAYYVDYLLVADDFTEIKGTHFAVPTAAPKPTATPTITPKPTAVPTESPLATPSSKPVIITPEPTKAPADKPIAKPTAEPTKAPTVEEFAERLYTTCLGREAEKDGKAYWTSELKSGKTGAEVAEGFFFSPEYEGRKLNNKDFIGTLYETFMGRTPAKDEVAYWSSEMDNGKTRKDIFDGFVNSPEWANICLTYGVLSGGCVKPTFEKEASPAVKAFAERLYTTCLGREAEKEGLEWWAAELANLRKTGTVAASGFFNSPEFIGLKTSDDEYVTRLYKTFMGREPEKAGFEFWTSELKAGKDRQYVFDGFSVAPEFANLCAEAGIMR